MPAAAPADPPALDLVLPVRPESVTRARHAAASLAEEAGVDADAVALAVTEAVGNAVIHAFRDAEDGRVFLRARLEPRGPLTVTVEDDGDGMRPNPASPGLGLGLSLIGSVAAAFRIERLDAGGTRVTMRFDR
jgi:anti-sigma regulatory factor (Ser/Thr protein kinase)